MRNRNEDIRKKEVLRYLRYWKQELEPETESKVLECIHLVRQIARPRQVFQTFGLKNTAAGLSLISTSLILPGKHIAHHLRDCVQVALLASTLGTEIDHLLQTTFRRDAAQAIILDAAANQYIEEVCDSLNNEIEHQARQKDYTITTRFSPGYGDLPLTIQPIILALLNAHRQIGLTLTESNLLLPQKSVTAIIGFRISQDPSN